MLAFGVPQKFDQIGNYIDVTSANWAMIISPTSTPTPAAAWAINQALRAASLRGGDSSLAQYVSPQAATEPATIAAWDVGLLALAAGSRLRRQRQRAGCRSERDRRPQGPPRPRPGHAPRRRGPGSCRAGPRRGVGHSPGSGPYISRRRGEQC
jgi:hypothetical protein